MITLYVNPNCPFCQRTVEALKELTTEFTLKDVHDPGVVEELVRIGGKKQMPFMVDGDLNDGEPVSMYESDDIIAYLQKKFA